MRLLYLDLDTLRADHLGCYSYHRNTYPHIDQIAAQGVRFDACYCSNAPCLTSHAALMTGRFGIHTGGVGHGGASADRRIEGPERGFRATLHTFSLPGPHTAQDLMMYDNRPDPHYPRQPGEIRDLADLHRLIDGYDTGIAYLDSHLGQLFAALDAQGVLDDLVIIISADHGENLGELGIDAEHATADQPTCRIPLIVRWPGVKAGQVDHGLHYNLDLPPRPVGVNFIRGRLSEVIEFLNELTFGRPTRNTDQPDTRQEWERHLRTFEQIDWKEIMAERNENKIADERSDQE